ncbi:MAG: hypothetical protein WBD97_05465, partial [Pseudolabrys sp.]
MWQWALAGAATVFKLAIASRFSVRACDLTSSSLQDLNTEQTRAFPPFVVEKVSKLKTYKFFMTENQIVVVSPQNDRLFLLSSASSRRTFLVGDVR